MSGESSHLLHVSTSNKSERLYKFTILTPHTFLPPEHSESLEDELAEEFAGYLCERAHELLGARSYIPHRSGEAFLNMRFDEFEEKFLRHSEYAIFITSGKNAASLDIIYPRMLVFLTIRQTWRDRGIVVYLGPPEGQKVFDPNLFLTKPLIFPLDPKDWDSAENPWEALLGRLQTQVPLTPEPMRSKRRIEPTKIAKASTNEDAATSPIYPLIQSTTHTDRPIRTKRVKHDKQYTLKFTQLSERGDSTRLFFPPPSSSSIIHCSPFRQSVDGYSIHRSLSVDDMCFYTRHSKNKSTTASKKPKEKQRRKSESDLLKKSKVDLLCIFSGLISPKTKRKEGNKQKKTVVPTPEVTGVIAPEIKITGSERKPLHAHCLQVQIEDEILDRRSTPQSAVSTSPAKRKTHALGSSRRTRSRWDSGIVSNYSLVSTETSTSYPSLHLHHNLQQTTTASPQSFLSSSSPSYLEGHYSRWIHSRNRKSSNGVSSIHSDSSIEEQRGNDLEDSLRFADEENLADATILSDKSGMCGASPFMKPGIPPLKSSIQVEKEITPVKVEPRSCPLIMNPDSKASTDSAEDPTISEEYSTELPDDAIPQNGEENYEIAITPRVTQLEQTMPTDHRIKIPDSLQGNTDKEDVINKSDLFIEKSMGSLQQSAPMDIQNPMSSVGSVGSCDHQSIFSSAETVIYGGQPLSIENHDTSLTEASSLSANVQKEHSDENQDSEGNSNLHSNLGSGITEKVFALENPIEILEDVPVEAISYQPAVFQTEVAFLKEPTAHFSPNNSSESEEITVREKISAAKPTSDLKHESTAAQVKVEMKKNDCLFSTPESLPNMSPNASTSVKASNDSGLHSIGSSDIASLDHSPSKMVPVIQSEEQDSLNGSPLKLPSAIEEAPEVEAQCYINPVQEGIVSAAVMIDDQSMPFEESRHELYGLSPQSEMSILEKSTDSGIQSAVSTLRKSTASTSTSVTDGIDQVLNTSEEIPEFANLESIEITPPSQNVQIVEDLLPSIIPVQEIPVSAGVRVESENISPSNLVECQLEGKGESKEAADIRFITTIQETPISTVKPKIGEEHVSMNRTPIESERKAEIQETTDILPAITPAAIREENMEISSANQLQNESENRKESVHIQPVIDSTQEIPLFAAFFGKTEECPMESTNLSERLQDSVPQNETPRKLEETDIDQFDTHTEPLIIQRRGTLKSSPLPADIIKKEANEEQELENQLSPSAGKQHSFDIDSSGSLKLYDSGAYEFARDMLRKCSPETLKLVRNAVQSYGQHPKFDKSVQLEKQIPKHMIISTMEDVQLNSAIDKKPHSLWKVIPQVSVALINLSTAYIPRYISTIYDYSMALLRPEHPDRNLRHLTTSVQEAFLNHPLGVPVLLAGTTIISPWVIRQFPLTIIATCQEAPDVLRRLLEQPGNFLAEHFADITEVFQATPTWSAFAIVGSRGTHWRRLRPTT